MSASDSEWALRFGRQANLLPPGLPEALRDSTALVVGLGAIGGAALHVLARSGIGRFILIDPDVIATENIAGQIFASTATLGLNKAEVGRSVVLGINPEAQVQLMTKTSDVAVLCAVMAHCDVAVLGMDTLSSGIACYRAARESKTPVIDFLYFPTPNVMSTYPGDPLPEERFGYPTQGLDSDAIDHNDVIADALLRVVSYGFAACPEVYTANESSLVPMLRRFLRFDGPVPSFAPLTVECGALMAREAISAIACVRGISSSRLGWPAFYVDTFSGRAARPASAYLSQMPGGDAWLEKLRHLRDSDFT